MPAEIYEVAALAARFWFLFLMVVIVWRSYRWYARDRRLRKKRLKELPDAGYIGEFVVMQSIGGLEKGTMFSVPFEGFLGSLRTNDIPLEAEEAGVAPRHLWFRYDRVHGLCLTPLDGNEFTVDQTPIADQPEGLYVSHGSWLYVGNVVLRLRMFEGYEAELPVTNVAPASQPEWWQQPQSAVPGGYGVPGMQPMGQGMPGAAVPYPPEPMQPYASMPEPGPAEQGAQEQPSPYGQRVRTQLSSGRRSRRQEVCHHAAEENQSQASDNPYRSRSSIPGLHRDGTAADRRRFAQEPVQEPPATPAREIPAPEAERETGDAAAFSSMSVYARMMAQACAADNTAETAPAAVAAQTDGEKLRAAAHKPDTAAPEPHAVPVRQTVPVASVTAADRTSAARPAETAAFKAAPVMQRERAGSPADAADDSRKTASRPVGSAVAQPRPVPVVVPATQRETVGSPAGTANGPRTTTPPARQAVTAARPAAAGGQRLARPGFAPAKAATEKPTAQQQAKPAAVKADQPARPSFAPEMPPRQEMVFEDPLPGEDSLYPIGQETFHPLMDEEDWDDWDEAEPMQPETPQGSAAALGSGSEVSPEEEWPYLSRTDQWQTAALFADLLDEDGTDAASAPGSAYSGSRAAGSTTRRLARYFKGGGFR